MQERKASMATYKVRGIAHNIIYPYRTEDGIRRSACSNMKKNRI